MYKYSDIIGQKHIKEHFQNAVLNDKISHAYIINGEKNSDKMMLADMFALSAMCEKGGREPCLECKNCKTVMAGKHPDIIHFARNKDKSIIDVGSIREQIVNSMHNKPLFGKYKIYIVDEADKMNTHAQNALLKTLEEPPEYGIIILLTENHQRFLPTIISRCIILNMRPVADKEIVKYLQDNFEILDSQAELLSVMASGNVGRARLLANDPDFVKFNNDIISIVKSLPDADMLRILKYVETVLSYIKGDKDKSASYNTDDFFNLLNLWYRDVLVYKSVGDEGSLIFRNEYPDISKQAEYFKYDALNEIINEINSAKNKITANVGAEMVIELLFIKIMEMSKW